MTDDELATKVRAYEGQALCPRCADRFPVCSDFKTMSHAEAHDLACTRYRWADDLCGPCSDDLRTEMES